LRFYHLVLQFRHPYLRFRQIETLSKPPKKDTDMAAIETTRTPYGTLDLVARINTTIMSVVGAISSWNDVRATRNALVGLSDRELDDIGLVRGDIDIVANGTSRF
jgi:uncharacterized protein YjiS (DUF1127 family)